jgi:hypothetical protein
MERRSESTQPKNVEKSARQSLKCYVIFIDFVIFMVFVSHFKTAICCFFLILN